MVLFVWPEVSVPTVTTAKCSGETSRPTMPCNRTTIIAARNVGSIESCGIEPCADRPKSSMVIVSQAARAGPGMLMIFPAWPATMCWPKHTSGVGMREVRPSATIAAAPLAVSSAGWNRAMNVPCQWSRDSLRIWHKPSRAVVCMSCPQACIRPSFFDANGTPVAS